MKQTYFTLIWSGFSASALIFQATYGGDIVYAIQTSIELLVLGLVFSMAFQFFQKEKPLSEAKIASTGLFSFLLLFGFLASSYFLPFIRFPSASVVSITTFYGKFDFNLQGQNALTGAFIFVGILEPNSEEQFFRGFWGNLSIFLFKKEVGLAPIFGGAIFALFHFAVYGLDLYTLGILFLDGLTIMAVDTFGTGDLAPGIIAHSLNNSLAFGIGTSILPDLLPWMPQQLWMPIRFSVIIALGLRLLIKQARAGRLVLWGNIGWDLRL